VKISAKADYAVRAMAELALSPGRPVPAKVIAAAQVMPCNFLETILGELRTAGLVKVVRGADGGSMLAKDAEEISLADILRAIEGPLAAVQGIRPERLAYRGAAQRLPELWIAVRANLRAVLERVSLADLAADELPAEIEAIVDDDEVWLAH